MPRLQICFVTQLYPPDPGGPATYAKEIEEGLPALGIEVLMVKFASVRHLPRVIRHAVFFAKIYRAARDCDLIFVQDTVGCGVPAGFAARMLGKPLLVRVPGDYAWEQGRQRFGITADIDSFQKDRRSMRARLLHALQRWTVNQAERVIVPSHYFGNIVRGWGIPDTKLRVVYHGLVASEPVELPHTVPKGKIMFSLGRFVPWKGFAMLVELLADLPDWHLVIVGDGPLRRFVEERARELGVSNRLTLTGILERPLVLGWYRRADAFVLNTSQENFSFQVLEGMMSGTPVITTAVGAIPELVTDTVEGLLLAPDDRRGFRNAVLSVSDDPSTWEKRTAAAKRKSEYFSLETMLSLTAAAIREASVAT